MNISTVNDEWFAINQDSMTSVRVSDGLLYCLTPPQIGVEGIATIDPPEVEIAAETLTVSENGEFWICLRLEMTKDVNLTSNILYWGFGADDSGPDIPHVDLTDVNIIISQVKYSIPTGTYVLRSEIENSNDEESIYCITYLKLGKLSVADGVIEWVEQYHEGAIFWTPPRFLGGTSGKPL